MSSARFQAWLAHLPKIEPGAADESFDALVRRYYVELERNLSYANAAADSAADHFLDVQDHSTASSFG
jgi:hypothetical protein